MLNRRTKKVLLIVVPLVLLCLVVWPINQELDFYSGGNQ